MWSSRPRLDVLGSASSRARIFRSVAGPIPGTDRRPPGACDSAKVVRRLDTERGGDLDHPAWRDPEQPAEADELRARLVPQRLQLCDRTRRRELAQARRDTRPDPAQLLLAPLPDELHDRRSRLADRRRRAPVRASGVTASSPPDRGEPRTRRAARPRRRCRAPRASAAQCAPSAATRSHVGRRGYKRRHGDQGVRPRRAVGHRARSAGRAADRVLRDARDRADGRLHARRRRRPSREADALRRRRAPGARCAGACDSARARSRGCARPARRGRSRDRRA